MYDEKVEGYFQNARVELLNLIPEENKMGEMLEIGAGGGNTLLYAKQNGYAKKVYGIELCELKNSFQKSEEFENFIIGNVEQINLPFENNFFDVILCGDVLEHLINPSEMIGKLQNLLKDNGVLIVSLPNIRQIYILKQIFIEGDFRYTDAGILDKTHLRFFCKKNMIELFENHNMSIKKIISNSNLIGNTTKMINRATFNLFDEFLAAQYYLVVGK